jgi:hypothetical protein
MTIVDHSEAVLAQVFVLLLNPTRRICEFGPFWATAASKRIEITYYNFRMFSYRAKIWNPDLTNAKHECHTLDRTKPADQDLQNYIWKKSVSNFLRATPCDVLHWGFLLGSIFKETSGYSSTSLDLTSAIKLILLNDLKINHFWVSSETCRDIDFKQATATPIKSSRLHIHDYYPYDLCSWVSFLK